MWYGGSYRECHRYEQSREAYSIIKNLELDKDTKFKELLQRGINKVIAARIIHLLHNQDFGVERYVE